MFGILKTIILSLSLTGSPATDINMNTDNPYVGTWEWEQTTTKGRGGENIANPTTTNIIKQVIITADNKVQILENGLVTCEGDFIIDEVKGEKSTELLSDTITEGCMKGSLGVVDGKLQHYVYLGCPSATSLYHKVK